MSGLSPIARRYAFDVLVVVLAIAGMLELAAGRDAANAPTTALWLAVTAIGIMVLPLFARRRYPFAALAAYWLLAGGLSFVDGRLVPFMESIFVLGMAVAFSLGNVREALQARIGLAVVLGGAAVIVYNIPAHSASELFFVPLLFGICWLAGFALHERAAQVEAAEERARHAEREREAAARIAVAEERARIARELHDIVAHAVSVMVLQIGAVRHKLPQALEEDKDALTGVERTGRAALSEMRRLLGAMRHDGQDLELTPQPGLDALDSLVEEVGRAGLPVRVHLDGDRFPLPRAIDLSAYRIIQEGLTNVLKHAGATRADVTVRYGSDDLQIEIRDDGRGAAATTDGLGHGLVGIRERVKIYGGEMTTGIANGRGFLLSTRLPVSADRP